MCEHKIREEIRQKMAEIEEKEQVRILHAVESGSRAWGFASPDSDYDVRFIYVRRKGDYLKIQEHRDVIEWQLDEVLDINGWDLKKALLQFRRGNATLFEWSNSPVVYKTTETWNRIYEAAKEYFSIKAAAYHYYGTANSTYCQFLQGETVKYKKYFYALRPLLAGQYIERFQCPPPVLFDELMKMSMTMELQMAIEELLERKKKTDEKELNAPIPVIQAFIQAEIARQKEYVNGLADDRKNDTTGLDAIFLDVLG